MSAAAEVQSLQAALVAAEEVLKKNANDTYFGMLSVQPQMQRRGLGGLLLGEVERRATHEHGKFLAPLVHHYAVVLVRF